MKSSILLPFALVAALAGCEPAPNLGPKAPHGGTILPIPEGKGTAEFVRKDAEGAAGQARYFVYFSGPDGKPLAPAPTSGSFKAAAPGAKPVDLKPEADGEATLSSAPLPNSDEVEGQLLVTIDGKPVAIPIKAR